MEFLFFFKCLLEIFFFPLKILREPRGRNGADTNQIANSVHKVAEMSSSEPSFFLVYDNTSLVADHSIEAIANNTVVAVVLAERDSMKGVRMRFNENTCTANVISI